MLNQNFKNVLVNSSLAIGATILSFATTGCGDDVKKAVDEVKGAAGASELQGKFENDGCRESVGFPNMGLSLRTTYDFSGNDVKKIDKYFAGGDCQGQPTFEVETAGEFKKGDEIQKDVNKLDLNFKTVSLIPRTDAAVGLLNTPSVCGKSDWAVNVAVDVTAAEGLACPNQPKTVFEIYTVENDKLFIGKGDQDNQTAEEQRPTELDRAAPYSEVQ